ncbi:MAG: hypothetical protein LBT20_04530 [Clostridiales bacterium]|nr:hypothetical protein [Clostridiales bacterium]
MLNELHKLSVTLTENNITQQEWHREYKPLPSGDCYRLWLGNDGTVKDVELMDKSLVALCRKYGNNHRLFPAFNIAPLYRVTSDAGKKYYDSLVKGKELLDIERLKSICIQDNWGSKVLKKINDCLHTQIPDMLEDNVVSVLMCIAKEMDSTVLRTSLETCVLELLYRDVKTYLPVLIFKGNADKRPEDDVGSLSIMLDVSDWGRYGNPIASEATTKQINERLTVSARNAAETATYDKYDAFGTPYGDIGEPMPSVKLPTFSVILRSMSEQQGCQYRYGNIADRSFPISSENRNATKTSLEWIARPENEYVTWRKIDKDARLFVYPDKLPEIKPKFAGVFSGSKSSESNDSRFKAVAKRFIEILNGLPPDQKPKNIQVFVLQQIQPAVSQRAKVVYTRNLTVDGLIDAVEKWSNGCENLPNIAQVESIIPFPLGISKFANKVWKQDGTRADGKTGVKLMQYYQGMELMLDLPQPQIFRILHGVMAHSLGLILFVGNKLPRVKETINDALKEEVGGLFSLMGLLLYKIGVIKEDYMQETAYLIGQILKISDELHTLYCEIKRDGDVPPQLAGNSVFVTASETPIQALALLCTRMNPYISWAKQYRTQKQDKPQEQDNAQKPNKSNLVAWYLRQYEVIATKLRSKLTEDFLFHDLEKAQLFIGYLAELPKFDHKQTTEQEDIQNEQRD